MLNIKDIRKDLNTFKQKIKSRFVNNSDLIFDQLIKLDEELRKNLEKQQELQNQRNSISKNLSIEKDKNSEKFKNLSSEVSSIKTSISALETEVTKLNIDINGILHTLPNIPLDEVPISEDEKGNVEIKKSGTVRQFDFEPLSHDLLAKNLNLIDFETAVNMSGSRFVILKRFGQIRKSFDQFYA